jgi:hypothetical protein
MIHSHIVERVMHEGKRHCHTSRERTLWLVSAMQIETFDVKVMLSSITHTHTYTYTHGDYRHDIANVRYSALQF